MGSSARRRIALSPTSVCVCSAHRSLRTMSGFAAQVGFVCLLVLCRVGTSAFRSRAGKRRRAHGGNCRKPRCRARGDCGSERRDPDRHSGKRNRAGDSRSRARAAHKRRTRGDYLKAQSIGRHRQPKKILRLDTELPICTTNFPSGSGRARIWRNHKAVTKLPISGNQLKFA